MTKTVALVVLAPLVACGAPPEPITSSTDPVTALPHAGTASPWGGSDPSAWRPEAVLANAASEALEEGWARPGALDVVVAVPVKMQPSEHYPFGDGQSNATLTFPYWGESAPPVVATLIRGVEVEAFIRFHEVVSAHMGGDFELFVWSGKWSAPRSASAVREDGRWHLALRPHLGEHELDAPLFVRPVGWYDGFPIDFTHPERDIDDLVAAMPAAHRELSPGVPIIDPAGIAPAGSAFDALMAATLPPGFNDDPYVSGDVHGAFPLFGQFVPTATGSAWSWLTTEPIKDIYICFEGRDPSQEAELGVPSGAGFHRIGDPAETLVNSLEDVAIPVAFVDGGQTPPPAAGGHAYQLAEVATYRLLQPGQAFTVNAPDYHGYLIPHPQPVCTQILVHPAPLP